MSTRLEVAARKLATALDLHELGIEIMRANLRRRHPDLDPDEIETRLTRWLRTRPGAEHGDAPGTDTGWPRRR